MSALQARSVHSIRREARDGSNGGLCGDTLRAGRPKRNDADTGVPPAAAERCESCGLSLRNRQTTRRVNTRLLRQVARHLLLAELQPAAFELCVHLIPPARMARLNNTYLHHAGSTDVITFDHGDVTRPDQCHGEIFICVAEAVRQARQFRTTWPAELVRYLIHGLLHLRGHDDLEPAARRRMKREENRLLQRTARRFPIADLALKPRKMG